MRLVGNVFIIPNPACVGVMSGSEHGYLNPSEVQVQVWVVGEGSDNWSCHGLKGMKRFPGSLPASALKGTKEGDLISLEWDGNNITLTACQRDFRYRDHGDFEEVVAKVLRSGADNSNHNLCSDITPDQVEAAWAKIK